MHLPIILSLLLTKFPEYDVASEAVADAEDLEEPEEIKPNGAIHCSSIHPHTQLQ